MARNMLDINQERDCMRKTCENEKKCAEIK